ncbi:glycosyltransferase family 25 protein [Brevundimonas sp. PAMC22021]|uniref:glycosyltransferase family 25 protein n=1 Tax=Brevundimonas sp. PAMC22021 TaxID=2861285 RepID=UPI001C639130|nr:glycosyltransferase family 25 protein [Brevundimonas sp. PAMC22021]QYF87497.1 glycosyltransferase family 25 protein [Brevundimonas sp. PAMC22021]
MDVFFINLDRAADRRAFMEAQGKARGVRLQRLRATEPKDLAPGEYERFADAWERKLTPNEIALLRSHAALWRMALDRPGGLVVLEDDAVLSPRFAGVVQRLPQGYDLINLEDFGRAKFFARRPGEVQADFSITRVIRDKTGSAAYHVSPAGAAKLLTLMETTAAPSDAFLFAVARLNMAQVEPALARQAHILTERGFDPGITIATSICKERIGAPKERKRPIFRVRRVATQFRLAGLHLRRLFDVVLRPVAFDDDEFRAILPIRIDQA